MYSRRILYFNTNLIIRYGFMLLPSSPPTIRTIYRALDSYQALDRYQWLDRYQAWWCQRSIKFFVMEKELPCHRFHCDVCLCRDRQEVSIHVFLLFQHQETFKNQSIQRRFPLQTVVACMDRKWEDLQCGLICPHFHLSPDQTNLSLLRSVGHTCVLLLNGK